MYDSSATGDLFHFTFLFISQARLSGAYKTKKSSAAQALKGFTAPHLRISERSEPIREEVKSEKRKAKTEQGSRSNVGRQFGLEFNKE